MFKDKELRKAFKKLVAELGGEANEWLYSVGGIYGIKKIPSGCICLNSEAKIILYALLDHLKLDIENGIKIVKKK